MDVNLTEAFHFLDIQEQLLNNDHHSYRIQDNGVEANYYDGIELKKVRIAEATNLDIERVAATLRLCEGNRKRDDLYELIYTSPFLIQIPNNLDHILINCVGPASLPHTKAAWLWEQRIPYIFTREEIIYHENGVLKKEPHVGQKLLKALKGAYYRISYDMNSYSSQHSSEADNIQKHTEMITLPNGDLIVLYFAEKASEIVEISHFIK